MLFEIRRPKKLICFNQLDSSSRYFIFQVDDHPNPSTEPNPSEDVWETVILEQEILKPAIPHPEFITETYQNSSFDSDEPSEERKETCEDKDIKGGGCIKDRKEFEETKEGRINDAFKPEEGHGIDTLKDDFEIIEAEAELIEGEEENLEKQDKEVTKADGHTSHASQGGGS